MSYIYHGVPKNLTGNILYPLNVIKEKFPELYVEKAKKYVGREHVMEQKIPILNCLWNDVLHFSSVNPKALKEALVESGLKDFPMSFYQIDPTLLDSANTVVYLYTSKQKTDNDFIPYDPNEVEKFSKVPQATKDYYKEIISSGGNPLMYHLIPHILHKGPLDISNMPIITV